MILISDCTSFFWSGISDTAAISLKDSQSFISVSGTYSGILKVIFDLLSLHNWLHVSILLDANASNQLYNAMAKTIPNEGLCSTLKPFFTQMHKFSGQDQTTFKALLKVAGATSRAHSRRSACTSNFPNYHSIPNNEFSRNRYSVIGSRSLIEPDIFSWIWWLFVLL